MEKENVIGQNIREVRKLQRRSGVSVANAVHISPGYLHDLEVGRTKPSVPVLQAIANTLGVSVDYLMGRDTDSTASTAAPEQAIKKAPVSQSTNGGMSINNIGINNGTIENSGTFTQQIEHPYDLRHNQQEHLRSITPPGRCTTGGAEIRPESVIVVPMYDYSTLQEDGNTPCAFIPLPANNFESFNSDVLCLIKQDIPFRLTLSGPIPATYAAVANKEYTFKNGFLYVVSVRGRLMLRRVTRFNDGSVELSCDDGAVIMQETEFKIVAKIEAAVPVDIINLG